MVHREGWPLTVVIVHAICGERLEGERLLREGWPLTVVIVHAICGERLEEKGCFTKGGL